MKQKKLSSHTKKSALNTKHSSIDRSTKTNAQDDNLATENIYKVRNPFIWFDAKVL
jgi:hypothetical protein